MCLSSWLMGAHTCADKKTHMIYKPTREQRKAARRTVALLPGIGQLLGAERCPKDGEESEPEEFV